ncbi:DUF342 domain-containing protein [Thermosulfuriphilus sp.]
MAGREEREKLAKEGIPILEGRFRVFVSPDELEAFLRKDAPGPDLIPEDYPALKEELKRLGIVFGLLEEPEAEGGRLVVARGKAPVKGEDARIELLVDLEKGPREEGKDRVDLREMNTVVCVSAGQPVARKIPPGQGSPGMNVFGEPLPTFPGKDVPFRYGAGLSPDEEGLLLVSEIEGAVIAEGEKLKVTPVFELNSDVNWDVGNIHFRGERLIINGMVHRGFEIESSGDLEIRGGVEDNVNIRVKGDLVITGLIHGEDTRIECQGEATIGALEYSQIFVCGDLKVTDYLLQPLCEVGGHLIVTEGVGTIVGGECLVRGSAEVRILGSSAHVSTIIRVGFDRSLSERLEDVRARLTVLEDQMTSLYKALKAGAKLLKEGRLPPEKVPLFEKIKETLAKLEAEAKKLKGEERKLREHVRTLRQTTLKVLGRVFPGVRIGIADYEHTVNHPLELGTFYLKEGQVTFRAGSLDLEEESEEETSGATQPETDLP